MHYLINMFNKIYDWWNIVMNSERNPLKNIQDLHVRHLIMQILAWMWCIIFSMYFGSMYIFRTTAVLHTLIIAGIAITFAIFRTAEKNPQFFMKKDGYHSFSRARQHMWINGKKIQLDPSDPGGEHE